MMIRCHLVLILLFCYFNYFANFLLRICIFSFSSMLKLICLFERMILYTVLVKGAFEYAGSVRKYEKE